MAKTKKDLEKRIERLEHTLGVAIADSERLAERLNAYIQDQAAILSNDDIFDNEKATRLFFDAINSYESIKDDQVTDAEYYGEVLSGGVDSE